MILIVPEDHPGLTADLLLSLQRELCVLRHAAIDLQQRLQAGETVGPGAAREIEQATAVARNCQKVEASFVEMRSRQSGVVQGGYALDLEAARDEIRRRLDRLRAAADPGMVPETD